MLLYHQVHLFEQCCGNTYASCLNRSYSSTPISSVVLRSVSIAPMLPTNGNGLENRTFRCRKKPCVATDQRYAKNRPAPTIAAIAQTKTATFEDISRNGVTRESLCLCKCIKRAEHFEWVSLNLLVLLSHD